MITHRKRQQKTYKFTVYMYDGQASNCSKVYHYYFKGWNYQHAQHKANNYINMLNKKDPDYNWTFNKPQNWPFQEASTAELIIKSIPFIGWWFK